MKTVFFTVILFCPYLLFSRKLLRSNGALLICSVTLFLPSSLRLILEQKVTNIRNNLPQIPARFVSSQITAHTSQYKLDMLSDNIVHTGCQQREINGFNYFISTPHAKTMAR